MRIALLSKRRPGFSLIELLVVIGIIMVLMGLLLPAVQMVRVSRDRSKCASNLHQLGVGISNYKDNHQGLYPTAAELPTLQPTLPSVRQVVADYTENNEGVWRCPADQQYFPQEGLSYEYPAAVSGKTLEQLELATGRGSSQIWLLYDFSYFHGPQFYPRSRNFLYCDGHVE